MNKTNQWKMTAAATDGDNDALAKRLREKWANSALRPQRTSDQVVQ